VPDRVADVLNRNAVGAHDRDGCVPSFMGVPVADATGLARSWSTAKASGS